MHVWSSATKLTPWCPSGFFGREQNSPFDSFCSSDCSLICLLDCCINLFLWNWGFDFGNPFMPDTLWTVVVMSRFCYLLHESPQSSQRNIGRSVLFGNSQYCSKSSPIVDNVSQSKTAKSQSFRNSNLSPSVSFFSDIFFFFFLFCNIVYYSWYLTAYLILLDLIEQGW